MIFCLGDCILEDLSSGKEVVGLEEISDNLLNIIKSNINILTVESNKILKVGRKILSIDINKKIKRVIKYCIDRYTALFPLTKKVAVKTIITSETNKKDSDIYISASYINEHELNLASKFVLLSESGSDCKFYNNLSLKILNDYYNNTKLSLKFQTGGGGTLFEEFETSVIHNKDFALGICDSDKQYPEDNLGNTAIKLKDKFEELKNDSKFHMEYLILEVHEKENLIRPSEYKGFLVSNQFKEALNKLSLLEESDLGLEYLKYIDFKNGIKKSIFEKNLDYFTKLKDNFPDFFIKDISECESGKEPCTYLLGRTCLNDISLENLNNEKADWLTDYRERISKKVYSWGISSQKEMIV